MNDQATRALPGARPRMTPLLTTMLIVVPLALAAAYGAVMLAGTKTGAVLALAAVAGPIAAYCALARPLLFPYCIFVLLIPFDFLLSLSSFGTLTKLVGLASGAALLVWLLRYREFVTPDRAILGWVPYIMWALCSLIWAIEPSYGTTYMVTVLELFGLYAVISFMPIGARTLYIIVACVLLSGVIASSYGIYLFHSGIDVSNNGRLFMGKGITSGQIDPNHFGASLMLPIALAIVAVVQPRSKLVRFIALISLLVLGGGIAVAGSRGSMLGLFAIVIYLIVRMRQRLVIAGTALAGMGIALAAYSNVVERFNDALQTGGAGRTDIWRVGFAAFKQHALIGAGFGNFQLAYNDSFLNVFSPKNPFWAQAPHSIIVSNAVELGLVGLGLFLFGWWMQFRSLRIIGRADALFPLRTALEAGFLGLFVASLFLDTYETKYLWMAFILMMLTRNAALTPKLFPARSNT